MSVLVAIDFSERSAAAIRFAVEQLASERIDLLHVTAGGSVLPGAGLGAGDVEAARLDRAAGSERRAERALDDLLAQIPGPLRGEAFVRRGVPADCICHEAASYRCVVVSTAGRSGLSAMLIGSVAEQVVRRSPVPVVVVR